MSGVYDGLQLESHGCKSSSHGRIVTCEASHDGFGETVSVCLYNVSDMARDRQMNQSGYPGP
eukprot:5498058-Pleurochrysis_carterae.AAC.2